MGLKQAVLEVADHADRVAEDDNADGNTAFHGIAIALRAAATASDEPIPFGLPVKEVWAADSLRPLILASLEALKVNSAGEVGDSHRWSAGDLATDLAPVLLAKMEGK